VPVSEKSRVNGIGSAPGTVKVMRSVAGRLPPAVGENRTVTLALQLFGAARLLVAAQLPEAPAVML
jgi:hypothetical protein